MGIARATTPTFTLTFTEEALDLTQATNVYVTFEQDEVNFTKTDLDVAEKQVDVYLSQEDTLRFKVGVVNIQVNWTMANGRRACSYVKQVEITKQLLRQVIE